MIDQSQAQQLLQGGEVITRDGDNIGKVGQVYLDNATEQPSWVTVKTGWFGSSESFVPLAEASVEGSELTVPYDKQMIKDAPNFDADAPLAESDEAELYRYYGLDNAAPATQGRHPDEDMQDAGTGHDTSGPETDNSMTRSEEQLQVGTEKVEAGRARLRKFVVTEQQTVTVPVSHQEARIVREPITDANRGDAMSGGDITEEEHELVLTAEQPVVSKETVPVERIRMEAETVTENQEVTESVRKEQVEYDVDGQDQQVGDSAQPR